MIGFWFRWMGITAAAFVVTFIGTILIIDAATGGEGPESFGVPFALALPGVLGLAATVMGGGQWLLMRRRVAVTWIPATAAGVLAGSLVVFGFSELTGDAAVLPVAVLAGVAHALMVGAIVGILQWLVVRRADPGRRLLWATIAAFVFAGVLGEIVAWYTNGAAGLLVIFLGWQAVSAPVLHGLLRGAPVTTAGAS